MAFTAIPNSSIDADSPLDSTLFTYLRDNDDYLKERFNITTGHNHDGTNDSGAPVSVPDGAITTTKIADANVTTAKVKLTQGNWSGIVPNYSYVDVSLNKYSFRFVIGSNNDSQVTWAYLDSQGQGEIVKVRGSNPTGSNRTGQIKWDYIAD